MCLDKEDSIGQATMGADRTITLWLRAQNDDGATIGHAFFTYSPTGEDYESIVNHVGGLAPGQSKPVPPWPDDPVKTS
jgi:hypothetical protein